MTWAGRALDDNFISQSSRLKLSTVLYSCSNCCSQATAVRSAPPLLYPDVRAPSYPHLKPLAVRSGGTTSDCTRNDDIRRLVNTSRRSHRETQQTRKRVLQSPRPPFAPLRGNVAFLLHPSIPFFRTSTCTDPPCRRNVAQNVVTQRYTKRHCSTRPQFAWRHCTPASARQLVQSFFT